MDKQDLYPVFQLDGTQGREFELPSTGTGDENIRMVMLQGGVVARFHASFRPFLRAIDKQPNPMPAGSQGISHAGPDSRAAPNPLLIQAGAVVKQVTVRTV
jgi:hypothetical protein